MADGSHAGYKIAWLNMSTVEEAVKLLSKMTPGEKAQLLQRVAQESKDAYPGIDTTVDVCGGEAVIQRGRFRHVRGSDPLQNPYRSSSKGSASLW